MPEVSEVLHIFSRDRFRTDTCSHVYGKKTQAFFFRLPGESVALDSVLTDGLAQCPVDGSSVPGLTWCKSGKPKAGQREIILLWISITAGVCGGSSDGKVLSEDQECCTAFMMFNNEETGKHTVYDIRR